MTRIKKAFFLAPLGRSHRAIVYIKGIEAIWSQNCYKLTVFFYIISSMLTPFFPAQTELLGFQLLSVLGKAFIGDGITETKKSTLVVCFGDLLIDFVPTIISRLSMAESPAFKKAAGGTSAWWHISFYREGIFFKYNQMLE